MSSGFTDLDDFPAVGAAEPAIGIELKIIGLVFRIKNDSQYFLFLQSQVTPVSIPMPLDKSGVNDIGVDLLVLVEIL